MIEARLIYHLLTQACHHGPCNGQAMYRGPRSFEVLDEDRDDE